MAMIDTDAQLFCISLETRSHCWNHGHCCSWKLGITAISTATCLRNGFFTALGSWYQWLPLQNPGQMCLNAWIWVTCLYPSCTEGWERLCVIFRFLGGRQSPPFINIQKVVISQTYKGDLQPGQPKILQAFIVSLYVSKTTVNFLSWIPFILSYPFRNV